LTQREFYQLYAFFNNLPENGLDGRKGNAPPLVRFPGPQLERQMEQIAAEIKSLEEQAAAAGKKSDQHQDPEAVKKLKDELAALKKRQSQLEAAVPTSMVMQDRPQPRETFVLVRGAYDKPGDKVAADVPAFLPPLPKDESHYRLALEKWLVEYAHNT